MISWRMFSWLMFLLWTMALYFLVLAPIIFKRFL